MPQDSWCRENYFLVVKPEGGSGRRGGRVERQVGELTGRLEAIHAKTAVLEAQRQAFETVIACYDPDIRSSGAPDAKRQTTADRTTPTKRVIALLRNRNPRHIALDILRESEVPVAAAEVALRFVAQEKLGDMVEGLNGHPTSRFAAILDGLYKQDLIRFEQSREVGSCRRWEINRQILMYDMRYIFFVLCSVAHIVLSRLLTAYELCNIFFSKNVFRIILLGTHMFFQFMVGLKKLRKSLRMTQSELGMLIGIDQGYVSRLETGKQNPQAETLQAIAEALEAEIIFVPKKLARGVHSIIDEHLSPPTQTKRPFAGNVMDDVFIPDGDDEKSQRGSNI